MFPQALTINQRVADEVAGFRPLPFLSNPHIQTLMGAYLPGPTPPPHAQHIVRVDDGDELLIFDNRPSFWRLGDPIAVLIHGLGGSALSPYLQRLAVAFLAQGVRAVRMNLRGAMPGVHLARGVYNACRSEDVRCVLKYVGAWSPSSSLLLLGVSLGGSLALRTAAELEVLPVAGLRRVAVVSPPLDLPRCCELLSQPHNRFYNRGFVQLVATEARLRQRHFPDLPPLRLPGGLTFRQFDELYTAPRCGFDGALDYYLKGAVEGMVPRIPIPALIVAARDDPFVCPRPFERMVLPANVRIVLEEQGGHAGFVGFDEDGGVRWAERRMVEFLCS